MVTPSSITTDLILYLFTKGLLEKWVSPATIVQSHIGPVPDIVSTPVSASNEYVTLSPQLPTPDSRSAALA